MSKVETAKTLTPALRLALEPRRMHLVSEFPAIEEERSMTRVNFPFWIVTQRRGLIAQPVEPEKTPGFIAVFSSAENVAKFMVRRGETEWENKLVSRSTFRDLMTDLRRLGVQGLCIDPDESGSELKITFDEMEPA